MQQVSEEKLKAWRLLIEERENNKLSIAEFCRQKNITASRYYYYQDLIKWPEKIKKKKQKVKNESIAPAEITPIKIIHPSAPVEQSIKINLPNSIQCAFPKDTSAKDMQAIVAMLLSC